MAEPTVPAAALAGLTIGSISVATGVPIWTVIAALVGATIAVGQSGRLELTLRGLWAVFISFALSVSCGIYGGPMLSGALLAVAARLGVVLQGGSVEALLAWVLALLGQSTILPAVSKRLGVEIETRGIQ